MAKIEIYTTPICGYCRRAKQLLDQLNVEYQEIDLFDEPKRKKEMMARSQRHTVPQIFIDEKSIGGYDELYALYRSDELEKLLQA